MKGSGVLITNCWFLSLLKGLLSLNVCKRVSIFFGSDLKWGMDYDRFWSEIVKGFEV